MITQINVIVHNTMSFDRYLHTQIQKKGYMDTIHVADSGMQAVTNILSPLAEIIKLVTLDKLIEIHNDDITTNKVYDDLNIVENDLDWD